MDDFLHNLRSGKYKRKVKDRRQYEGPNYKGTERRTGRDRRNGVIERLESSLSELVPEVKSTMTSLLELQKRMVALLEENLKSETRKVRALEGLTAAVSELASAKVSPMGGGALAGYPEPEPTVQISESERKDIEQKIIQLRDDGLSYEKIARSLMETRTPTFSGKGKWHGQTVQKIYKLATG